MVKLLNKHRYLEDHNLHSLSLPLEHKQVDCLLQPKAFLVQLLDNKLNRLQLLFSEALLPHQFLDSPNLRISHRKVLFQLVIHYFQTQINKVNYKHFNKVRVLKYIRIVLIIKRKINKLFQLNNSNQIFFKTNLPRL